MTLTVHSETLDEFLAITDEFILEIKTKKWSRILKMICMRFDKRAGIPGFHFMRMLCKMNSENLQTEILSDSDGNYSVRQISDYI